MGFEDAMASAGHMQTISPRSIQITTSAPHHSIFTGRMLFLTSNATSLLRRKCFHRLTACSSDC